MRRRAVVCADRQSGPTGSDLRGLAGLGVYTLNAPGRWCFGHEYMRMLWLYFGLLFTHDPHRTVTALPYFLKSINKN